MVGDYLQNTNGNVGEVIGVAPYAKSTPEVIMCYHDKGTCFSDPKLLEPIPITPEILEKNGWFYKNGYWTKKGPVRLSWHEKDATLIAGYWTVPAAIEYVHSLQTVLHLLGLPDIEL